MPRPGPLRVPSYLLLLMFIFPGTALAAGTGRGPELGGVPLEFGLFFLTLVAVAAFHKHTLRIALTGLAVIVAYKLALTDLHLVDHLRHEWVVLTNLLGL